MVSDPLELTLGFPAAGRATNWARAASRAYIATGVAGTVVSVLRGRPAEALGIRTSLPVPVDVSLGLGAALAAPWPMLVALWRAQTAVDLTGNEGRKAKARLVVLSALFLAGSAAEPISHDLLSRRLRGIEAMLAATNLTLPLVVLWAAVAALMEPVKVPLRNAAGTPARVQLG